ncbi:MAG TPA: glycosyltransferase [Desulfobacteraceae bacterium]|nr:glycosyltransferase [Desulfobacteraceae bacterium]
MKVLINIPGKGKKGGVLSHYEGIRPYLLKYSYYYNSNGNYKNCLMNVFIFPFELVKFLLILIKFKPDVVVLNPSLFPGVFLRDSIYLKTSKLFGCKSIVFFHGWYDFYQVKITEKIFKNHYGRADSIIVLSSVSKKSIYNWGFKKKVYCTTTRVDNNLLSGFNIKARKCTIETILFLARIEKYKGIYLTLEVFSILKEKYPNLKLNIVGDGSELASVKKMINQNNLRDIHLKGFLSGDALAKEYIDADIYILPSISEGLPATILEAMAFGLPIISSNVGGHRDFFTSSMGRIVNSFEPNDYAVAIEEYINDCQLVEATNAFNHNLAMKNFLSSKIAADFEEVISEVNLSTK